MAESLKRTSLNELHRQLGARMVEFAGWEMPVQYEGPTPEHLAVRTAVGLFDVSHMGEIELKGRDALRLIQSLTPNDAARLSDGQAHYSALLYPEGTFVDDILVHRFSETHYFLCVNASNSDKDFAYLRHHAAGLDVEVADTSAQYCQIAVQGPRAVALVGRLAGDGVAGVKYYWFTRGAAAGVPALIARTGYTGEDGFELYVPWDEGPRVWQALLEAGREFGVKPAGLAARNTLRLEAKMALYGHEIDHTTTVLEADLGWICKLDKGDFVGRDVLARQKAEGVSRKLIGFEVLDRAPVCDGYPVLIAGQQVGAVTSGSPAPYLKKNIGLCYLPAPQATAGTEFTVLVRGREVPARVVPTPFYKRAK